MDIDALDNAASELVQLMFDSLRKSTSSSEREVRFKVESLGKSSKGLRHALIVVFNQFQSLYNAVSEGELSVKAAETEMQKVSNVFLNAVATVSEFMAQDETKREVKDVLTRQFIRNATATSKAELNREVNKHGIYVGYAPVIPLTQSSVDIDFLQRKGLKVRAYEGYVILEKQLVAGMTLETQGKISGLQKAPSKGNQKAYADFVDTVIAKFKNQRLVEIGNPTSDMSSTWTWLMPAKEFDLLGSAMRSKVVKSWGFAFTGAGR